MSAQPKTLGNYNIERVLGSGAMGTVYKGFDSRLRRPVAIKTIRRTEFGDWSAEECSARFLREARAVAERDFQCFVGVAAWHARRCAADVVILAGKQYLRLLLASPGQISRLQPGRGRQ